VPPVRDVHTALTMIIGSAGLLQDFHRALGPEDIELLAGGILEAAVRLNRVADGLQAVEVKRPPSRPPRKPEGGDCLSGYDEIRAAATEAAFRDGRRPDLQLDLEDIPVMAPPSLVRRMVAELVHEACRISDRGTAVRVRLRQEGLGCRLEVAPARPRTVRRHPRLNLGAARLIAEATDGNLEVDERAGTTIVRLRWGHGGRRHSVRIRIPYDNPA
jgi:K+-sensing histidine kinase KdpD